MAKAKTKKETEQELNLDQILFKCRDHLRAARNSGSFFEKRDMMLTLVFLRFLGEKYEDGLESLKAKLISEGLDPEDENIRISPTFPTEEELQKAMDVFVCAAKLAAAEQALAK